MILTQMNIFWKCVFILAGFNLCFSLITPAVTRIYMPHRVRTIAAGTCLICDVWTTPGSLDPSQRESAWYSALGVRIVVWLGKGSLHFYSNAGL